MIRYPLLSAGSSWTDEYGNRRNMKSANAGWANCLRITIFQTASIIRPHSSLPAFSDDRVHPAHALSSTPTARNLAAILGSTSPDGGGHTGNGTQRESADELALCLAVLKEFLGRSKQQD